MPGLTRYGYRDAVSGFFEFPTENARRLLPAHLQPVEVHHGTSVLSVTAFEFTETEVGSYGEIVMAVVVPPLVRPGERLPKSALYPYRVGTTTKAARDHAIERWHLPHWMEDVEMRFLRDGRRLTVSVGAGGRPVLELEVNEHSFNPVSHLYQSFMKDDSGAYIARITMEGGQSEHEDEMGRLRLHPHPFHAGLDIDDVSETPFRELWMRDGMQTFEPLAQLETA